MTDYPLPDLLLRPLVEMALREDLGDAGDLTSLAAIPPERRGRAVINTRKKGHLSGTHAARLAFTLVDPSIDVRIEMSDGAELSAGDVILIAEGPARALLTAERTALNLLGHMSGIATATGRLVHLTGGIGAQVACTRKTLPGLRAVQKHAVRCGGAKNHRFGLHDAVMIKDNHIIAAGGIAPALKRVKEAVGHTVKIEVEVDTLDQLDEVLREGADIVLLDNMDIETLRAAVGRAKGQVLLEASGNVSEATIRAIAETGVDLISSGAITHSAPNLDIGLELELL